MAKGQISSHLFAHLKGRRNFCHHLGVMKSKITSITKHSLTYYTAVMHKTALIHRKQFIHNWYWGKPVPNLWLWCRSESKMMIIVHMFLFILKFSLVVCQHVHLKKKWVFQQDWCEIHDICNANMKHNITYR